MAVNLLAVTVVKVAAAGVAGLMPTGMVFPPVVATNPPMCKFCSIPNPPDATTAPVLTLTLVVALLIVVGPVITVCAVPLASKTRLVLAVAGVNVEPLGASVPVLADPPTTPVMIFLPTDYSPLWFGIC